MEIRLEESGSGARIERIEVSATGDVFVAGSYNGTVDFDPSSAVQNRTAADWQGFIAKYDESASLQWVETAVPGITDFELVESSSEASIYASSNTNTSSWLAKLTDGDSAPTYEWQTKIAETGFLYSSGIAVDRLRNTVYVSGHFGNSEVRWNRPNTVTVHGTTLTSRGQTDVFLASFSTDGDFQWARSLGGGSGNDGDADVVVASSGIAYVTGSYFGTATIGTFSLATRSRATFVAAISPTLASAVVQWVGDFPNASGGYNAPNAMTLHESSSRDVSIFIAGDFVETVDFDPTAQTAWRTSTTPISGPVHDTGNQGYVVQLGGNGAFKRMWQLGENVTEVDVTSSGLMHVAGQIATNAADVLGRNCRYRERETDLRHKLVSQSLISRSKHLGAYWNVLRT